MVINPLSPVASAQINTLLVPAGKIKCTKFSSFVSRLEHENLVRLGDVSPNGKSNKSVLLRIAARARAQADCPS